MKYNKAIVPSLFTMLNLFFGFFAIVNALQGKLVTASWLILVAVIWDILDGKVARLTGTYSEFGVEFDSLSDIVSFGAAPAILIHEVFFYKFGAFGIIFSFLPLLFGAIRLARFNVTLEGFEKDKFSGLPVPTMASVISAYIIFNYDLWAGLKFAPALFPLVLLLCILMISNVEYVTMPSFSFKQDKKNTILLVFLILGFALVVTFRERILFPLAMFYVLFYMFKYLLSSHKDDEEALDVTITK